MNYLQKITRLYGLSEAKSYGFKEADIERVEKDMDFVFPNVLRGYYLTLAKNKRINDSYNRLLKLKKELYFTEDRCLVFYAENQEVVCWGIKEEDLKLDNPCIYRSNDPTDATEQWILDNLTTETFLLSMSFWNGVSGGLKYSANTMTANNLTVAVINKVGAKWTELKGLTNQQLRFFSDDCHDIIVFITDNNSVVRGIFAGSNNKKKYNKIIDELGIEWDYRSDLD